MYKVTKMLVRRHRHMADLLPPLRLLLPKSILRRRRRCTFQTDMNGGGDGEVYDSSMSVDCNTKYRPYDVSPHY